MAMITLDLVMKEPKLNMHGDHPATCLCCKHYDSDYDQGWSDVTPGMGDYFFCKKKVFTHIFPDSQDEVIHIGLTCAFFEGR